MARIVVSTFGSAGDLNPMLALGIGLRERGHAVLFAVEDNFRPAIAELGFEVHQVPGDSVAAVAPFTARMFSGKNPVVSLRLLLDHYLLPTLPGKIERLRAACAGADLLVSTAMHLSAAAVADLTEIPWASVVLTPAVLPSAAIETQPPPIPLPPLLERLGNRLSWALGHLVFRALADRPVNRIRASFGLPPRRDVLWLGSLSSRLTCLACSPAFQPPARDWPAFVRMTGFCFWDTSAQWTPSVELRTFLDDPAPLIAVTAGSIAPAATEALAATYATSIEAVHCIGARALVIGAAPKSLPPAPPGDMLAVPFVPYSQVFSRCSAIIHHGGIGTTGQCLRAGVPALVIPWGFDQYYTAGRVARLGTGRMLLRDHATVERTAEILRALLHDPQYARAARDISDRLAREDGVASLCAELGTLVGVVAH